MFRRSILALMLLTAGTAARAFPILPASEPTLNGSALFAAQESEEREPGPANLQEAIEIAVKRYGGRAADADTVIRDGVEVHEIRLFSEDGTVRTVRIDPETGRIIPPPR